MCEAGSHLGLLGARGPVSVLTTTGNNISVTRKAWRPACLRSCRPKRETVGMAGEQRSKGEGGMNVNRAEYVCLGAWEKRSRELKYRSGMEHEGPMRECAQAADPLGHGGAGCRRALMLFLYA